VVRHTNLIKFALPAKYYQGQMNLAHKLIVKAADDKALKSIMGE
jgi:hypothetical protein